MTSPGTQQDVTVINWSQKTTLPNDSRYKAPVTSSNPIDVEPSDILLTGVDSFIEIHMLQTLLLPSPSTRIQVIGTISQLQHPLLVDYLQKYSLLSGSLTEETVHSRLRCVPGALSKPHFGLEAHGFKALGRKVQAIYHFGGQISLLKTYTDLKPLNVSAVLVTIELAACGEHPTKIHHLSTWSVPRLQTWSATNRTKPTVVTSEAAPTHFSPPATDDFGYFKSRWVRDAHDASVRVPTLGLHLPRLGRHRQHMHECTRARGRFHPAHGARDDCIGIRARYWGRCRRPTVRNRFRPGQLPLVANVHKLSINSNAGPVTVCDRKKQPAIFHIGNPNLLPLNKLGGLMEDIRGDQTTVGGGGGGSLSLERWFQLVLSKDNANEDERLRWARLRDYLRMEHVMFALDGQDTKEMIKMVRGDLGECPPVDGTYLGRMWRNGRG